MALYVVSVSALVRQVLMIPENEKLEGFHEIWCRERWQAQFSDV